MHIDTCSFIKRFGVVSAITERSDLDPSSTVFLRNFEAINLINTSQYALSNLIKNSVTHLHLPYGYGMQGLALQMYALHLLK